MSDRILANVTKGDKTSRLQVFIHDAKRFSLYSKSVIEEAPLQLYYSALIFAPKKSIVRGHFSDQSPTWIYVLQGVPDNWSSLLQTLEAPGFFQEEPKSHLNGIRAVAFSPNGKQLASSSYRSVLNRALVQNR